MLGSKQRSEQTDIFTYIQYCMCIFCMCVRVHPHPPGHACVFRVSSCIMHMWVWVPRNFYQKDLLLTARAKASSWPSHHALSVGSLECAGMWAPTGGEVLLRDRHPDTTLNPLSPSFSHSLSSSTSLPPPCSLSFKFPLTLCLENECQETALLFSPCTWGAEEKGSQTNWREKVDLTWEQESRHFLLFFFLVAIFFLCLIDWVGTPLSPHLQRDSHSPADGLSGCFGGNLAPHSQHLFIQFRPKQEVDLCRLNWRNNLPEVVLDKTKKNYCQLPSSPIYPPLSSLYSDRYHQLDYCFL